MRLFRKAKPVKNIKHHPLLGIDFENSPETGLFLCCGIYGRVKYRGNDNWKERLVELYFDKLEDVENYLLSLKRGACLLVFYNASYDKVFLHKVVDDKTVIENRGRFITAKLKNGIKCYDLTNHSETGMRLEDWIEHLDLTEKFGISKLSFDDLEKRVMADAAATFRLGEFIENFYTYEMKIPFKLTVASNALALFGQYYFNDYWYRSNGQDWISDFERRAYYGGRCEIFKRGKQTTYDYDVNSMYLSIMRTCNIPDILTTQYIENGKHWEKYLWKYDGIFNCRVYAPAMRVMVLPYRDTTGKLIFPCGEFSGSWTSPELRLALEYGYKILECYDFIYYGQSKPYFSEFAEFVWSKRLEYKQKGNKAMDLMIKKIGNSLYGKFAQRLKRESYYGKVEDAPDDMPIGSDEDNKIFYFVHPISGVDMVVWTRRDDEGKPAPFEFPVVSAFITSYARIKLFKAMKANEEALVYCDTDSIKVNGEGKGMDVGSGLGQWGFEGIFTDRDFYRAKHYGLKHKGVPKRAKLIATTKTVLSFVYDKPLREKEAFRRGDIPNRWIEVRKDLNLIDDKRIWVDGESYPLILTTSAFNRLSHIDYIAITDLYGEDALIKGKKRWGEKLKLSYNGSGIDDMSPADRGLLQLEKQDKRRSGQALYRC